MWARIEEHLDEYPARKRVVRLFLRYGLKVTEDARIKCGDIEVSYTKISKALGIDRRVVKETATMILKIPELREIFTRLEPTPHLKYAGRHLGYGVIEIEAEPRAVGMLAKVASKIAERGRKLYKFHCVSLCVGVCHGEATHAEAGC
ncbi:regulator [Thermococcus sp. M39]|uniref:regulator n=1 Tax=unclassified Thermococcus TaxID=2627626 RepID=UPI00143C4D14|nr:MULTISPECIES: regulator [unclassified Thermococcus]NJE09189.1 regulator [Thermococcus sp. M39]NJE13108.1 regulator [Thermococcus sp. LS2]